MEHNFTVKFMGKCTFINLARLAGPANRWPPLVFMELEETTDTSLREKCQNIYSMKQTFLTAVFKRFFAVFLPNNSTTKSRKCQTVKASGCRP